MVSSSSKASAISRVDIPEIVSNFLNSARSRSRMPARFVSKTGRPILELQYLLDVLDVLDAKNIDSLNARVRFAVTTDGFDLWVGWRSAELAIFQEEFGDVESLGLLMTDLMEADMVAI